MGKYEKPACRRSVLPGRRVWNMTSAAVIGRAALLNSR
jgi:hypothetical protein